MVVDLAEVEGQVHGEVEEETAGGHHLAVGQLVGVVEAGGFEFVEGGGDFFFGGFEEGKHLFAREVAGGEFFVAPPYISAASQLVADEVAQVAG